MFIVAEVLEAGLRCLGSSELYIITLSPENVRAIYSDSDNEVMNRLHEYLDGNEIELVNMGNVDIFVLQWWKTFSRHYFLDYSSERYLLKNLIHVAEEDGVYIKKLMEEQKNATDYMGKRECAR